MTEDALALRKARQRRYYLKHREVRLAKQAEYDAARVEDKRRYNRERGSRLADERKAYMREYYVANRERTKEQARGHYRDNREAYIRRAQEREGKINFQYANASPYDRTEIDQMYLFTSCFPWYEVDHVIPLKAKHHSGLHVRKNLQVITKEENRRKRNSVCPAYVAITESMV